MNNKMVERSSFVNSNRSELISSNVREQEKCYNEWIRNDSQFMGQQLLAQSFDTHSDLSDWKQRGFHEEGDYDFYCTFIGDWENFSLAAEDSGLQLKGRALQVPIQANLRSLALDLKFRLTLTLHSSFYIFLRVINSVTYETPVLKIVKDANLKGIFFVFAHLDPESGKFKFIKQNQVPENVGTSDDVKELEIGIIDNGNDRVFVSVSSCGNGNCVKKSNFTCSGFLPEFGQTSVWIAGIGNGVVVKQLSIQYRERIVAKTHSKKSPDCVCIIN
jgi:hypothetical protein